MHFLRVVIRENSSKTKIKRLKKIYLTIKIKIKKGVNLIFCKISDD